ncbi:MAG: chemotaxis protein CheW [Pseudomonadota bacterium]
MEAGKHLVKLRDFSTQLAERLKAAPQTAAEPTRLAVRIGAENYLLPMEQAGEIVAVPDIAPVPWTKPWYRGLANVRGRLVGVIDLMQLVGRPPLALDQASQMLVLGETLKVNAAILVTRAFGLRNLKDLEPVGRSGEGAPSWEAGRFRDLNGTVLTELDLGRLVTAEAFASIGI